MQIDTSKIKVGTKSVAAVVTTFGALWQVQAVHDDVLKLIASHPHWSGAVALIATLWALLHNPEVQQILHLECDAK